MKHRARAPLAATWLGKCSGEVGKCWQKVLHNIARLIATVALFVFGATVQGDWIHIGVHFLRAFNDEGAAPLATTAPANSTEAAGLEGWYMKDLPYHWLVSVTVSYAMYLGAGGLLHWYYYVKRRHLAHEWKCQPDSWLTPELQRQEILLGSFSLLIASTISSVISCYVINGGPTTIYYDVAEYGWPWYLLSWPVTFVYQDYLTYWLHRMYHHPILYKRFHKLHHIFKQPTAFSTAAVHPVEFVHMQVVLVSPMFLFPVHWSVFVTLLMYLYYHGILNHSGVNFKASWWQPWQPDSIFHDSHHQYFHVNFGFNCALWDKLHGTYRHTGNA